MLLQNLVFLHGEGNYMGRNFCAVVTGDEAAAGGVVNVKVCTDDRERGLQKLKYLVP